MRQYLSKIAKMWQPINQQKIQITKWWKTKRHNCQNKC